MYLGVHLGVDLGGIGGCIQEANIPIYIDIIVSTVRDPPKGRGVLGGPPLRIKELPYRRGYEGKLEFGPGYLQAFHYWEVHAPSTYYY